MLGSAIIYTLLTALFLWASRLLKNWKGRTEKPFLHAQFSRLIRNKESYLCKNLSATMVTQYCVIAGVCALFAIFTWLDVFLSV